MNILLGPPCSGKGTLARNLKEKLRHIAPGELLRNSLHPDSEEKRKIDAGYMVVDIVNELMVREIRKEESRNILLDGYPRVVEQAQFLKNNNIRFDNAFVLHLSEERLFERMLARTICSSCQESFRGPQVCCSQETVRREDDEPEKFRRRLETYNSNIGKILEELEGPIYFVDASSSPEDIKQRIMSLLSSS